MLFSNKEKVMDTVCTIDVTKMILNKSKDENKPTYSILYRHLECIYVYSCHGRTMVIPMKEEISCYCKSLKLL